MGVLEVALLVVRWVDPMEVLLEVPLEARMGHRLGGLEVVLMEVLKARVDWMAPAMEGCFLFLP